MQRPKDAEATRRGNSGACIQGRCPVIRAARHATLPMRLEYPSCLAMQSVHRMANLTRSVHPRDLFVSQGVKVAIQGVTCANQLLDGHHRA